MSGIRWQKMANVLWDFHSHNNFVEGGILCKLSASLKFA